MKKLLLLILLSGCAPPTATQSPPKPQKVGKVVSAKHDAVENRFSTGDFVFGNGSITKSQTVYYLLADDGTYAEVTMPEYMRVKVGDTYVADKWNN